MSQRLTVLFPDGHRKTMPVTPNMSLYQVLEDACRLKGFPVHQYSLKHYKTILSPSLTVRFANLPNNALLELVESAVEGPLASKVTICLQTEDGSRQTQEFDSAMTMWDMVIAFDSANTILKNNTQSVPVCVYANAEYVGEDAMKAVSLRQIGLINGRHMVRLLLRTREGIGSQAYAGAGSPAIRPETPSGVSEVKKVRLEVSSKMGRSKSVASKKQKQVKKDSRRMLSPAGRPSSKEPKHEQPTSQPGFHPRQQPLVTGSGHQEKPFQRKPEPEIKLNVKDYRIAGAEQSRTAVSSSSAFEMTSGRRLESSAGTGASFSVPEVKGETVFLDDEGSLAFHSQTAAQAFSDKDVPDDFFEHTVTDVKYLYRVLKAQRQAMEEAPLLTAEQRKERQRQRKIATCGGVCVLRIHFPDRMVLQSLFSAEDRMESVKARVRTFLRDPGSRFFLYLTPPRRVLADNETLLETGCCPTSVIYFGVEGSNGFNGQQQPLLNDHVMANLSTASGASSWASSKRPAVSGVEDPKAALAEYFSASSIPDTTMEVDSAPPAGAAAAGNQQPSQSSAPGAVPKWFKLGR